MLSQTENINRSIQSFEEYFKDGFPYVNRVITTQENLYYKLLILSILKTKNHPHQVVFTYC